MWENMPVSKSAMYKLSMSNLPWRVEVKSWIVLINRNNIRGKRQISERVMVPTLIVAATIGCWMRF